MDKQKELYVCIRMGDNAEYERFDTLEEAARYVGHHVAYWDGMVFWQMSGVQLHPNYTGYNYISVYWGDADVEWYRDLTRDEREDFISLAWGFYRGWLD